MLRYQRDAATLSHCLDFMNVLTVPAAKPPGSLFDVSL